MLSTLSGLFRLQKMRSGVRNEINVSAKTKSSEVSVCLFMAVMKTIAVMMAIGFPTYIWCELHKRKKIFCGGLWHQLRHYKVSFYQEGGCMGDSPVNSYYCTKCDRAFRSVGEISSDRVEIFAPVTEVKKYEYLFERTKNFALGVWK